MGFWRRSEGPRDAVANSMIRVQNIKQVTPYFSLSSFIGFRGRPPKMTLCSPLIGVAAVMTLTPETNELGTQGLFSQSKKNASNREASLPKYRSMVHPASEKMKCLEFGQSCDIQLSSLMPSPEESHRAYSIRWSSHLVRSSQLNEPF